MYTYLYSLHSIKFNECPLNERNERIIITKSIVSKSAEEIKAYFKKFLIKMQKIGHITNKMFVWKIKPKYDVIN